MAGNAGLAPSFLLLTVELGPLIVSSRIFHRRIGRVIAVVGLAFVLTAVIASLSLRLSEQFGRLSVPPLYDDVVYFVSAIQWMNQTPSHGVAANILGLLHQHAPFSTLMAAIGFYFRPQDHVGPYAINAVVILAFLLGVARLLWSRPLIDIAVGMIGAATVPVVWQTMTEARPDLPWGLALGLAVGAVVYRPLLARSGWSLVWIGVLGGLASSIKPSAFPASLALLGLVACVQVVGECLVSSDVRSFRAVFTRGAPTLLLFAAGLLAGAMSIIGIEVINIIGYIVNTMIHDRDFWGINESFVTGLFHYSIGTEGLYALNYWLWIGLTLAMFRVFLAVSSHRRDLRAAFTVLAAGFVAYAIPSVSNVKSFFLGAIFYGVFIVTMTLNFGAVVAGLDAVISRQMPRPALRHWLGLGLRLIPLAAVLSLFIATSFPWRVRLPTSLTQDQIQDIRTATAKVWSLLQEKSLIPGTETSVDPKKVPIIRFSSPYPVTSTTIQLYAVQAHSILDVRGEYFNRTLDAAEKELLASDVVVVTSSMPHNLPGPRMGDELISRMDVNPGMCLVVSLPLRATREVRIYRRGDPGCAGQDQ
jgi:hypothetical protein